MTRSLGYRRNARVKLHELCNTLHVYDWIDSEDIDPVMRKVVAYALLNRIGGAQ